MAPRREPASLYDSTKAALTNDLTFRVRAMFQCWASMRRTLDYLDKVISSLPPDSTTDLAQKALSCADLMSERSRLSPSVLRLLARVLIHDSTRAFDITTFNSYRIRQAVLDRVCELRHLQVYHNLQYLHENFNIFSKLQKLQSLPNLRQVYLSQWCSDEIAYLLGKSCPNLQLLDAESSSALTDLSVPSLIQCQRLKVLLIYSTSISDTGYQTLLENLPLLSKIGPCDRLNLIVSRMKTNRNLSLRQYESCEMADENVVNMCPRLTSVHLYVTRPWEELSSTSTRLLNHITHLKFQANNGSYLNQLLLLTSSVVHLDLQEYAEPVTQENVTTIAEVCTKLRILRLNHLHHPCRLVTTNQRNFLFNHLEELEIPNSALAVDILHASPRIRHVSILAREHSSLISHEGVTAFISESALQSMTAKASFKFLESFILTTRCNLTVETVLAFIQACPRLRSLGRIEYWCRLRSWESEIYSFIQRNNLAVELIL